MRVRNSLKNMATGIAGFIIADVVNFIVRLVFIRTLGEVYLGVDGLFANIITILSISELGIGTAIIFNLYKPIADNDEEKIKSYMDIYKKCYLLIALVIAFISCLITPILPYVIKNKPDIPESLYTLYFIFIANTVISYLFSYKQSLIIANQKLSIINIYTIIVKIASGALQIISLLLFNNYIIFLVLMLSTTLLNNIILSFKSNKMFPYLRDKAKPLDKELLKKLIANVKSMFLFKISDSIMSGIDNILISATVGVIMVGRYSNYMVIISAITTIIRKCTDGLTASIGNLHVTESSERHREIFETQNFASFWICGFASVCFYVLFPHFIAIAFGESSLLDNLTMTLIIILFYIVGILHPISIYRYTTGLFMYGKVRAVIMPLCNIIFSILLVKSMGLSGIFLGTILARAITQIWYDPLIVYKYDFKVSIKQFYLRNISYLVVIIIATVITSSISNYLPNTGIGYFLVKMVICAVVPNLIFTFFYFRAKEFTYIKSIANQLINKLWQKGKVSYIEN